MDTNSLKRFLIESNRAGYAGGKDNRWVKESDGSTSIVFEQDQWKSDDNFYGGEPYGGRTIVFHEDKPFWMMVYYGWVEEGVENGPVYGFLRKALLKMPEDYPFRGPKSFTEGTYSYVNTWDGTVERFAGEEKIRQGQTLLYTAHYGGGLVDQQGGV